MHPGQNKAKIKKRMPSNQVQCCSSESVPVVAVCPEDLMNYHTRNLVVVSTGLRWWPCCCPGWPCAKRGGRKPLCPRISACLISACKWHSRVLLLLWLFMSGLHPHPGPSANLLVHASTKYTGAREGTVFKRGTDGMGYYSDHGGCTLELAPLINASASLPPLPLQLFSLLGLGLPADPPRYPSGPSGNGRRRTRGGAETARKADMQDSRCNKSGGPQAHLLGTMSAGPTLRTKTSSFSLTILAMRTHGVRRRVT